MTTNSTADSTKRLTITLSREELYVVMRLIKAKQLPGFSLDWLSAGSDGSISGEMRQALEAAANGLVARGYLSPVKRPTGSESFTVSMPSPVIALVGAAAFSDYTMLLSLQRTPAGPMMLYFHGLRKLGVIHSMPYPGIHQFEAVDGQASMVEVINEVLHLRSQPAAKLLAGAIPLTAMQEARDAVASGAVKQAQDLLLNGGLAAETANALVAAMASASVMGAIIIGSRGAGNQVDQMVGAVAVAPEVCFLITEDKGHSAILHVQSLSADTLRKHITAFMFVS